MEHLTGMLPVDRGAGVALTLRLGRFAPSLAVTLEGRSQRGATSDKGPAASDQRAASSRIHPRRQPGRGHGADR